VEFHGLACSWIRLRCFLCGLTRGGLWLCRVSRMMALLRQRALLLVFGITGLEDYTKADRAGALETKLALSEDHVSKTRS
jgi:hypothetical protein